MVIGTRFFQLLWLKSHDGLVYFFQVTCAWSPATDVRMCLRNLGMVWGNYLIIEVAGIPLHIREHPEHFGCNIC